MTIFPTHACFDDALDFIPSLIIKLGKIEADRRVVLIHAICTAPDGSPYAHAWIEDVGRGKAYFAGLIGARDPERFAYVEADAREYRDGLKIQDETRYSIREASQKNFETGNYGPWIERYEKLCGGGREWIGCETKSEGITK